MDFCLTDDQQDDYLDRSSIIDRIEKIIKIISAGSGIAFGIDGSWGCGKTFLLKKLQYTLSRYQSEETAIDTYHVIYYNCWELDYYEEPLIAIAAIMANELNLVKSRLAISSHEGIKEAITLLGNYIFSLCPAVAALNAFPFLQILYKTYRISGH